MLRWACFHVCYRISSMPNLLSRRWVLPIFLFVSLGLSLAQTVNDFSGQWVMKLGERTFLVLAISPQTDGQLPVSGYLIRPQHFRTNGYYFSHINNISIHEPIIHAEVKGREIQITVQNPEKATDTDTYEISLADSTHVKLKMIGVPLDPLVLIKDAGKLTPAADWDPEKTYSENDSAVSNPEMKSIFEEDQRVRQPKFKIDWAVVSQTDEERRDATRKLLSEGKLHTGDDFERAAFLFQHSSSPNDYLLAHTLAVVAVSKGQSSALWISTATLDRYLQTIHQPQIFGTQFSTKPDQPTTQEPYDRGLISDALRHQLYVPSQAAQDEQRKQYDADRKIQK